MSKWSQGNAMTASVLLAGALAVPCQAGEWHWGRVTALKSATVVVFEGAGASFDVRLAGVDAPEPGQPFAERARQFVSDQILDHEVRLRAWYRNEHDEIVAQVLVGPDGRQEDAGLELVRAGLAWRIPDVRYKPFMKGVPDYLTSGEDYAREQRAGLWAQKAPVAPWDFRRQQGLAPLPGAKRPAAEPAAEAPRPESDLTPNTDVDVSQRTGDDNECAIAKNPSDANQLFELCNVVTTSGMLAARSTNGGATWIYPDPSDKTIADGDAGQGPSACCDPTMAWDRFGNLFITYINAAATTIETILSTDGGATFSNFATFNGSVDQPTVAQASVGANSNIWIVWNQGGSMVARGTSATGLGTVAAFPGVNQAIPSTSNCSFGDIAVASSGAVVQVCENPTGGQGPATLRVNVDADGLGAGAFAATASTVATNVGGFDFIQPQNSRSVDAEAGLTFDQNPASPHFGRLYLVYTEEPVNEASPTNTDIMVRVSDNNGGTWSSPIKVDDDSLTTKAQFLPKMASDPATGNVGVCWHDCRNSAGNTAMQLFCTATSNVPASPTFAANVLVSNGTSTSNGAGVEFGDYAGLVFSADTLHPAWADTSNFGGSNPNGTSSFDAFTDRVTGPPFPVKLESLSIE